MKNSRLYLSLITYDLRLFSVFAPEFFHPPGGVNQPLFAGVKRVAFGTYLYANILLCGAGVNYLSAGTGDCGFFVFWMNLRFHLLTSLMSTGLMEHENAT